MWICTPCSLVSEGAHKEWQLINIIRLQFDWMLWLGRSRKKKRFLSQYSQNTVRSLSCSFWRNLMNCQRTWRTCVHLKVGWDPPFQSVLCPVVWLTASTQTPFFVKCTCTDTIFNNYKIRVRVFVAFKERLKDPPIYLSWQHNNE